MPYTKEIGTKNFYNYYKEYSIKKNREYVDYKTYSTILKEFNLALRDKLVYNSEHVTLPYRLGKLYIHKFENNYSEENQKSWSIDFKKTKELGHIVYYGSKYGYRWKWDKKTCIVKGKRYYTFKACRTSSRLIADAIKNKQLDYYH
jgi:hypothetical protein